MIIDNEHLPFLCLLVWATWRRATRRRTACLWLGLWNSLHVGSLHQLRAHLHLLCQPACCLLRSLRSLVQQVLVPACN